MDNDTRSNLIRLLEKEAKRLVNDGVRKSEEMGSLHGIAEVSASRALVSIIECLKKL